MKKIYKKRIIDNSLNTLSKNNIGILITGVKGCGKTESAKQIAKSEIIIDDSSKLSELLNIDRTMLISGEKPRLIDEWQLIPWIWNYLRHEIDNGTDGALILTGSSTPSPDIKMHSGAGRFVFLHMRPMSWWEIGWSDGMISLKDIFDNKISHTKQYTTKISEIIKHLTVGGWPFLLGLDVNVGKQLLNGYINGICEIDISQVDGVKKDPHMVRRLLRSLARNIATPVTNRTLINEMGDDASVSPNTYAKYYDALERIHIVEDLSAWNVHIRSSASLKKNVKRYFVDPSIAFSILSINEHEILNDLNYLGLVFENEVIKNLRIYAEQYNGKLYYYGDSYGNEVDAIIELPDGSWSAFEIKLGYSGVDKAVKTLKKFMDVVDLSKIGRPKSLNIITFDGILHKRKDGINVIPLCALKP